MSYRLALASCVLLTACAEPDPPDTPDPTGDTQTDAPPAPVVDHPFPVTVPLSTDDVRGSVVLCGKPKTRVAGITLTVEAGLTCSRDVLLLVLRGPVSLDSGYSVTAGSVPPVELLSTTVGEIQTDGRAFFIDGIPLDEEVSIGIRLDDLPLTIRFVPGFEDVDMVDATSP